MKVEQNKSGQVRVYDLTLRKWIWTQPVDARQGIERGQFAAEEPVAEKAQSNASSRK